MPKKISIDTGVRELDFSVAAAKQASAMAANSRVMAQSAESAVLAVLLCLRDLLLDRADSANKNRQRQLLRMARLAWP